MTAVVLRGIDVSHHNGIIGWKSKRASQGLDFGMAKCVQGLGFYDPQYIANREGCHLSGMPFIAYAYVEPGNGTPAQQVAWLIKKAGSVEGYCMDLEISNLSQTDTNLFQRQYGDELRAQGDRTTYGYLGGYAANGSGQGAVDHFDHWIYPHYTRSSWPTTYAPEVGGNTTGWKVPPAPSIWQCSDNIGGTDADVSNLTLSQLFSGADMPLTQADAELVADVLLARATIASSRADDPSNPPGKVHSLATWISAIDAGVFASNGALAGLPDAVVAKLPPASAGGLTTDQVKQAVKDALKEGTS